MSANEDEPPPETNKEEKLSRKHPELIFQLLKVGPVLGIAISVVGVALAIFAFILNLPIESGQGTTIGGLAVLIGAALTFYSAKLTRDRTSADELAKLAEQQNARKQAHHREVMRDLQLRFTSSTTQLANDAATIRLAGVYSLASLADDWYAATGSTLASERDRQVCIDVLCAYLRRNTTAYSALHAQLGEGDVLELVDALKADEDIVRTAIITAIRTHTTHVTRVTNDPSWRGADFDLTRANLDNADLRSADLRTSLLPNAELDNADLKGCILDGSDLDGAKLRGAQLNAAHLNGAHMKKAKLEGAQLDNAEFRKAIAKAADFTNATGSFADFRGAKLHSANFTGADLGIRSRFDGAYLYDANFANSKLTNACFDGATLDGADFRGVDLSTASLVDVVIGPDQPMWPDNQRPDHVTVAPATEFPDPNDE